MYRRSHALFQIAITVTRIQTRVNIERRDIENIYGRRATFSEYGRGADLTIFRPHPEQITSEKYFLDIMQLFFHLSKVPMKNVPIQI